jgi:hypothetical protein
MGALLMGPLFRPLQIPIQDEVFHCGGSLQVSSSNPIKIIFFILLIKLLFFVVVPLLIDSTIFTAEPNLYISR